MNFAGLIRGTNKAEVGFDDLQADMAEALEESLRIGDPAPEHGGDPTARG